MSENIYKILKEDEGYRSKMYRCPSGKWTIGYGWNIEDNGIPKHISEALLRYAIEIATADVFDIFGTETMMSLSDSQFDCLIMMSYNLGKGRLMSFKKMIQAVKDGDFEKASIEMLDSRWSTQVGDRAIRLSKMMVDINE